jgi:uncharacterized protein YegJ (DUF2314 family)
MRRAALSLFLILSLALGCKKSERESHDIIYVKGDDAAMTSAIARARAELAQFQAVLAARPPNATSFMVKVGFKHGPGADDQEHIWLAEPEFGSGKVSGKVDNEPVDAKYLVLGQVAFAPLADISDWMYVEGGVMKGGYTTRVLLDRMSPVERQKTIGAMGMRLE